MARGRFIRARLFHFGLGTAGLMFGIGLVSSGCSESCLDDGVSQKDAGCIVQSTTGTPASESSSGSPTTELSTGSVEESGASTTTSSSGGEATEGTSAETGSFERRCGDGVLDPGELCDAGEMTADCDDDCTVPLCGDGVVNPLAGEACDENGSTPTCDYDCTEPSCGDGVINFAAGEVCDDGGQSDVCTSDCTFSTCGDGVVNEDAGEDCDAGGILTETCDLDCTFAECGDGLVNALAGEICDAGGADALFCDADCTLAECGDEYVNAAAGEQCETDVQSAECEVVTCRFPACGDGVRNALVGEVCEDGNTDDGDGCDSDCSWSCQGGGVGFSDDAVAPNGGMMACAPAPGDFSTCHEDLVSLCPTDWHMCTEAEIVERNEGWNVQLAIPFAGVGATYDFDALGQRSVGINWNPTGLLSVDSAYNCPSNFFPSDRTCYPALGCSSSSSRFAICCADSPECGDGVVDPGELCDDGNDDPCDDCAYCSWRQPDQQGLVGACL